MTKLLSHYMEDFQINPNNPDHIFVAGQALSWSNYFMALHKSTNGGTSWSTHSMGPANGIAYSVAINPQDDNIIYLGGAKSYSQAGLFKSQNGGANWTEITGSISGTINTVVVDPAAPNRVYVGSSVGFFKSEDSGGSWSKKSNYSVGCIKINPADLREIYFGGYGGVYQSSDYGSTWTEFNSGLEIKQVNCLAMNAASKILYAGTSGGGVYKNSQLSLFSLIVSAGTGGTTTPAPGAYQYPAGTSVTITAKPDAHYAFAGWSGNAAGNANPMTIIMDSDKAVTANFIRNIYAPLNFTGAKKENRSLLLSQYINVLTWQAHPNNINIEKYRIYQLEGAARTLLAEVGSNVLEFRHLKVAKDKAYTYVCAAVNNQGREGEPETVTIR